MTLEVHNYWLASHKDIFMQDNLPYLMNETSLLKLVEDYFSNIVVANDFQTKRLLNAKFHGMIFINIIKYFHHFFV